MRWHCTAVVPQVLRDPWGCAGFLTLCQAALGQLGRARNAGPQKETSSRNRGGSLWRLERTASAAPGREREASGRLGPRQFPGKLGWRNPDHPSHLRTGPPLCKDGGSSAATLAGGGKALEPQVALSYWRPMDGRYSGRIREGIAAATGGSRCGFRDSHLGGSRQVLPAD